MLLKTRHLALCAVFLALASGCSIPSKIKLPASGYPEAIYTIPADNPAAGETAMVFGFTEPPYAPGVGRSASLDMAQALVQSGVFAGVKMNPAACNQSLQTLNAIARHAGCTLFICGNISYYFEGSDFAAAGISQDIRVFKAGLPQPLMLWQAEAREAAAPIARSDYILFHSAGAAAPPTDLLLERNSAKFSHMIRDLPPSG